MFFGRFVQSHHHIDRLQYLFGVSFIVEVPDDILTFLKADFVVQLLIVQVIDLVGTLERILTFDMHLQQVVNGRLQFALYVPELFVYFIAQDFPENRHIIVFTGESLDGGNDAVGCFNSQTLS